MVFLFFFQPIKYINLIWKESHLFTLKLSLNLVNYPQIPPKTSLKFDNETSVFTLVTWLFYCWNLFYYSLNNKAAHMEMHGYCVYQIFMAITKTELSFFTNKMINVSAL